MRREEGLRGKLWCGQWTRVPVSWETSVRPERGGNWELRWAHSQGWGAVSGFPWLPAKSLEEEGKPADRFWGAQPVLEGLPPFILPAELSECQGKLQELHRLLQSLESLHRIPSAPVIPTHQVRSRGGCQLLLSASLLLAPFIPSLPWDRSPVPLCHCCFQESHASA